MLGAVLALLAARAPTAQVLESWLLDSCFLRRGVRESKAKLVLIAIDDASLESMQYPLVYISPDLAKVVRFLREQNTAAIGIDLLVPDYLRDLPGIAAAEDVSDDESGVSQTGAALLPDGNPSALREEIRRAGNVVLIEYVDGHRAIKPLPAWYLSPPGGQRDEDELPADLTCVTLTEDADYVVRRQSLWFNVPENYGDEKVVRAHLALALAAVAEKATVKFSGNHLMLGDEEVPVNERGQLEINYVGPAGSVPAIEFRDVVEGRVTSEQKSLVQGAVAIIGVTARSQKDHVFTPYSDRLVHGRSTRAMPLMPGPELHANIVATLSDRAFLWRLSSWWELTFLLTVSLGLGYANVRWGVFCCVAAAAVLLATWWLMAVESLSRLYLVLPMTSMLFVVGLSVVAAGYQHLWWMRRLLGAVKSRQIARVLESNKGLFAMQGEQRLATILFADIRGFSDFSRPESPQTVTRLLNAYFAAVVPILERHGGVINQYMGDGVMVLFNLPEPLDNHAACAVRAAVEMVEQVRALANVWKECGMNDMRIGVGINTGLAVAGVVGSPRRLDYTAIGDTVNTAARTEAANKDLGTEILISDSTFRELTPQDRARFCGGAPPQNLSLKGVGRHELYTVRV